MCGFFLLLSCAAQEPTQVVHWDTIANSIASTTVFGTSLDGQLFAAHIAHIVVLVDNFPIIRKITTNRGAHGFCQIKFATLAR